jgi:tetratricopeptide (TPR) repeat protein
VTEGGARSSDGLSALLAEIAAPSAFAAADPAPQAERTGAGPPLAPGRRIGRFELVRELGRGGFGLVFEAIDHELRRRVAFKAVRPAARSRVAGTDELLRREAEAIAQLSHANIVTLFDVGRSAEGPFLVLELLRGETLDRRLARGPLYPREAVRVALAVARALVHAHAAGVLHRDLKPSNVFLTADAGVKVLDFGLAHLFGVGGPARSGTPGYMAPEQLRGDREDARTDVFAVGILLAEMIGGRRHRTATEALLLAARLRAEDPADRPQDAAALARELALLERALSSPRRRRGGAAPAAEGRAERAAQALRHFFLGEQCSARPLFGQDCARHYRRAVELDPTLAAAHYQLAIWARRFGGRLAEQRRQIARALRHLDRAPEPEQVLIRGFAAHVEGRDDEAIALFREATERWPEDKRGFYEIGDVLRHADELELAAVYLGRAAELDPDSGWASGQLAEALGALGRDRALRAWIERWSATPTPVTLHALCIAHGWLGEVAASEAAARRAISLGSGLVGQQDLLGAIGFLGRYEEVEELARGFAEPGNPVRRMGFYTLAALEAYRGRRRAGLAWLDALPREVAEIAGDSLYHAVRADYLLGDGDPGPVLAELRLLGEIDPRAAAEHAAGVAWIGADGPAAELAGGLKPRSPLARAYEAVAAFRGGTPNRALALLRGLVADAPVFPWRAPALWFQADLCLRAGRHAEALAALERLERLYLPRVMWRSWTHPRALVMLARCHEALGDLPAARGALGRFRRELAYADPDLPLLAEAGTVGARLGP